MWTYNISMENLFKIEASYAVIQSQICGANVLKRAKDTNNYYTFSRRCF